jgi:hypothetical protein
MNKKAYQKQNLAIDILGKQDFELGQEEDMESESEIDGRKSQIIDESPVRDYFTMIPNILLEYEISPYAGWLYMHYKKTTGETGVSWKSMKTLGEECHMSPGSVSNARKELIACGLVRIEKGDFRKHISDKTFIVDIWQKNHDRLIALQVKRAINDAIK